MKTQRTYLKKTISEIEIRVRLNEQLERFAEKLREAVSEEEWSDASHLNGVLTGIRICLSMQECFFENLSSQQETDHKVRMHQLRGF